jgi:hypothetical protein
VGLAVLLAEVDPGWLGGDALLGADLAARARESALGRRMLASWLAAGPAAALLGPDPARDAGSVMARWPRTRIAALCRDVGVLAYAPAIRAEVGREPVRRLKAALGSSYLLALDRSVWDGVVDGGTAARLGAALSPALTAPEPAAALYALFDQQGRAEVVAWARRRDPPLADWCTLLHPPGDTPAAHLPEKPVLRVYTHHEARPAATGEGTA